MSAYDWYIQATEKYFNDTKDEEGLKLLKEYREKRITELEEENAIAIQKAQIDMQMLQLRNNLNAGYSCMRGGLSWPNS